MLDEWKFWLAIAGATVFKLMTSPFYSLSRAIVTVVAAIFTAWVFTDAALDFLHLPAHTYREPVAAVLALMGEGSMRWLIHMTPEKFLQSWKRFKS